jgi:hypothetical protein
LTERDAKGCLIKAVILSVSDVAWLFFIRPCGVQLVVQDWYTEDSRVFEEWPDSDPCKTCPMPVIEG